MNISHMVAMGMREEHTVAAGIALRQTGDGERLLSDFSVRAGKLRSKVQKDAGGGCCDLGDTAADLVGAAVDRQFHKDLLVMQVVMCYHLHDLFGKMRDFLYLLLRSKDERADCVELHTIFFEDRDTCLNHFSHTFTTSVKA